MTGNAASPAQVVSAESKSAALSVLIFIGVFVLLQIAIIASHRSGVDGVLVHKLSAVPAAMFLAIVDADDAPRALGNQLIGQTRRLTIEAGCDGTETIALLIASIAALRLPLRRALTFLFVGGVTVLVLNQLRVATLWWALGTNTRLFDVIHGQIAPAILMSAVGVIVLLATRAIPSALPA